LRRSTLKDERGNGVCKGNDACRDGYRNTKSNQLEFAFPLCVGCLCSPFIFMWTIPRLDIALAPLDPIRPGEALLLCPLKTPIEALAAGDGFSVMERLKANDSLSLIPVIVVSGRNYGANVDRVLSGGAKAFLQKPVDNAEFLSVIRQALGEKKHTPAVVHDLGEV
jgi:CheY-like chemotaxis protein